METTTQEMDPVVLKLNTGFPPPKKRSYENSVFISFLKHYHFNHKSTSYNFKTIPVTIMIFSKE